MKATFNCENNVYVCLCAAVTESAVVEAIEAGASSVEEVAYCTGAGTRCGTCVHRVAEMVAEAGMEAPGECAAHSRRHFRLEVLSGAPA